MESFITRSLRRIAIAALALAIPATALAQSRADLEDAALSLRPGQYLWRDSSPGAGDVSLVVSIPTQVIYVYRGSGLIGVASISTGKAGHRTPTGDFTILQKQVFHRSNLYSNAPMPYMQRLTWTGIALHAGHNPGAPASHGCIRLPSAFAKLLYGVTSLGVPVAVVNGEWSVPQPDEDFPVIIADAADLRGGYTSVTWSPDVSTPARPADVSVRPALASTVVGGHWDVPDTQLWLPVSRDRY